MLLGERQRSNSLGGDPRRDPLLIFYDVADFLQYTTNLQDRVFYVAPFQGSIEQVIHPHIEIRDIILDPYMEMTEDFGDSYTGYWRSDLYKEKICPVFGIWTYYLRYFGFVDFLIGCIRENKKYNPSLPTAITICESLFNTFAYEKFKERD